jgi:transcription initiation factor IIE alpha subunit
MTAAVLEKPVCRKSLLDGGDTLEELLTSALREAAANGSTDCPVCGARMSLARAAASDAECGACGSRLS